MAGVPKSRSFSRFTQGIAWVLLLAAFIAIQILIGGTRPVFNLPAYGLLGVTAILGLFSLRGNMPPPRQLCLWTTLLLAAWIVVRGLFSPVPYLARFDVHMMLAALGVYLCIACVLVETKKRMAFLIVLLIFALAHVAIGALQFRDGNNYMPISWLQRADYGKRASGFYICPNHLAGLLEVLGMFGLGLACWSRLAAWLKLVVAYAASVCLVGVLLTGSRGGYVSALAGLGVFVFLSLVVLRRMGSTLFWRATLAATIAAVLGASVIFLLITRSDAIKSRAQNVLDLRNVRLDMWQASLRQWQISPVLGTGSRTYLFYGRLFRSERVEKDPVYVHNDYLQLLAEYGVVGVLIFLGFYFMHLRAALSTFKALGPTRARASPQVLSNALALNLGAISAVAAMTVHSVLDFNMHIPANALLLAFVFGLMANDGAPRERVPAQPALPTQLWRSGVVALGVVLVWLSVKHFPTEYYAEHARAALRDHRNTRAIAYSLRGLEREKNNPYLYFYLGSALSDAGDRMEVPAAARSFYVDAIEPLQKARALVPQDTIYALRLGRVLAKLNRFPDAEQMFYNALQMDPKSMTIRRSYENHRKRSQKALNPDAPEQDPPPAELPL